MQVKSVGQRGALLREVAMDIEIKKINKNEVLKYLAFRGSEIPEDINSLIDECIEEVKSKSRARYFYAGFDIDRKEDGIFLKGSNFELIGEDISKMLEDSDKCILMAATLGVEIDNLIRQAQIRDLARSIILDSCASSGIESVCNAISDELEEVYKKEGLFTTDRFSPGYGDMPIEVQKDFVSLLDAQRKIGLTVSSSGLMIPRKSVTAIVGISKVKQVRRFSGCENCRMFLNCEYRKAGRLCRNGG